LINYLRFLYIDYNISSRDYDLSPVSRGFLQIKDNSMIFSEISKSSDDGFDGAFVENLAREYIKTSGLDLKMAFSEERRP
jgi:hypothetical protein